MLSVSLWHGKQLTWQGQKVLPAITRKLFPNLSVTPISLPTSSVKRKTAWFEWFCMSFADFQRSSLSSGLTWASNSFKEEQEDQWALLPLIHGKLEIMNLLLKALVLVWYTCFLHFVYSWCQTRPQNHKYEYIGCLIIPFAHQCRRTDAGNSQ